MKRHTPRSLLRLLLVALLLFVTTNDALIPPQRADAALLFASSAPGFIEDVVVNNLPLATAVAWGGDLMFIALKGGMVRVVRNGALLATPFIDLSGEVNIYGDRGLLDIAVHPDFPNTPYVYLLYTYDPPGLPGADNAENGRDGFGARVSRLLRVKADPALNYAKALPRDQAAPDNQRVILGTASTLSAIGSPNNLENTSISTCAVPNTPEGAPIEDCIPGDHSSHQIGSLRFGRDGGLFISVGDSASFTQTDKRALRAQNLDWLSGKLLRIDPLTGAGWPENPFYDAAHPNSNRSKVYSYGLRNPFRFTLDPVTDEPVIGDVGWNNWEELNTGKGANFGWPCYEGGTVNGADGTTTTSLEQPSYRDNTGTNPTCASLYAQGLGAVKPPLYAYSHVNGGASANAGTFYTGSSYPAAYHNALFFMDYNRRWIRTMTFDATGAPATVADFAGENGPYDMGPVELAIGPDTNVYVVMHRSAGSEIRRIRYIAGGNTPPTAVVSADQTVGQTPLNVQFSSDGTFDPDAQPLSYAWDFGDGATSTQLNPRHLYTTPGIFDATLTVTEQTAPFANRTASVRITVGNSPPRATILSPADGSTYQVGDTINYSGSGTDNGNPVGPDQLSWELRLHHNDHIHYELLGTGASGSLAVQEHGDSTWLELCLTSTDSFGYTDTQCVQLTPRKVTYTADSQPRGLRITYEDEGIALTTQAQFHPIIGSNQTLSMQTVQQGRTFVRWSDGVLTPSRSFIVGSTPLTMTAIFVNRPPVAAFSASPISGVGTLTSQFSSAGSADPENTLLSYEWDFGDGSPMSSAASPSHTFTAVGSYTVTLTVTDALGASAAAALTVTVNPLPPTATPSPTPSPTLAPTPSPTPVPTPPAPTGRGSVTLYLPSVRR